MGASVANMPYGIFSVGGKSLTTSAVFSACDAL